MHVKSRPVSVALLSVILLGSIFLHSCKKKAPNVYKGAALAGGMIFLAGEPCWASCFLHFEEVTPDDPAGKKSTFELFGPIVVVTDKYDNKHQFPIVRKSKTPETWTANGFQLKGGKVYFFHDPNVMPIILHEFTVEPVTLYGDWHSPAVGSLFISQVLLKVPFADKDPVGDKLKQVFEELKQGA